MSSKESSILHSETISLEDQELSEEDFG